jgi:hypothetical protein
VGKGDWGFEIADCRLGIGKAGEGAGVGEREGWGEFLTGLTGWGEKAEEGGGAAIEMRREKIA